MVSIITVNYNGLSDTCEMIGGLGKIRLAVRRALW